MPKPPEFFQWPWEGEVTLKVGWKFELPTALVATMPQREVIVRLSMGGESIVVATKVRTWEPPAYGRTRGKIELLKTVGTLYFPNLPCRVHVDLRVAEADEAKDIVALGPHLHRQGAEPVRFVEGRLAPNAEGDVDSLRIPAALARGITPEDAKRTWWVRLGDFQEYPTVLRRYGPEDYAYTHRLWVPVPRGFCTGDMHDVTVSLFPGWVLGRPDAAIDDANVDWAAFAPGGHATAFRDGKVGLGVYGTTRFTVLRRAPIEPMAAYLGAYLAEGQKTGTGWSFAGVMLGYLKSVVDWLEQLGVERNRLRVEVRRPWDMPDSVAVGTVAEALGLMVASHNGATSGVWPVATSIYSPDSDGQLSANLRLQDGLSFRDATVAATAWMLDHPDAVPVRACKAFMLGYLGGDGTVLGADVAGTNRPTLGLSGPEQEVRAVSKIVNRAMGDWEGRLWYYTGGTLRTQLSVERIVALLRAGAFAVSMSRARLLEYLESAGAPEAEEFIEEIRRVKATLGGDFCLARPGALVPGRKCVVLPLGRSADERDVEEVSFKHFRPMRDSEEEAALVLRAFAYYREAGFPYPVADDALLSYEIVQLGKPRAWRMEGTTLQASANGVRAVTAFHPELWTVRCESYRTPLEAWESDEGLKRSILCCIRFKDGLDRRSIRDAVSTMVGRKASVMRPGIAKAIYDMLRPGRIVDPCAGWGSRLLAALAGGLPYASVDASSTAQTGNERLLAACRKAVPGAVSEVGLAVGLAEETLGTGIFGGGDLVFTSPPYHDRERYSGDVVQSHVRYPSWDLWVAGFLRPLLAGAAREVEVGGHVVLSIRVGMEMTVLEAGRSAGLVLRDTWTMLTPRQHFRHTKDLASRGDPILVFRKPS